MPEVSDKWLDTLQSLITTLIDNQKMVNGNASRTHDLCVDTAGLTIKLVAEIKSLRQELTWVAIHCTPEETPADFGITALPTTHGPKGIPI